MFEPKPQGVSTEEPVTERVTFLVTEAERDELDRLAYEGRTTKSEVIRQAMRLLLKRT